MKNDPFGAEAQLSKKTEPPSQSDPSSSTVGQKRKRGRPAKSRFFDVSKTRIAQEDDTLPATNFDAHHHISDSKQVWLDVLTLVADHHGDPAVKVRSLDVHGTMAVNTSSVKEFYSRA